MPQTLPGPSITDLRLDEIAAGQWRVCDRRFRETNAMTLLGFVQQTGLAFEVTRVSAPREIVVYDSLDSATAAFVPVSPTLPSSEWTR